MIWLNYCFIKVYKIVLVVEFWLHSVLNQLKKKPLSVKDTQINMSPLILSVNFVYTWFLLRHSEYVCLMQGWPRIFGIYAYYY